MRQNRNVGDTDQKKTLTAENEDKKRELKKNYSFTFHYQINRSKFLRFSTILSISNLTFTM